MEANRAPPLVRAPAPARGVGSFAVLALGVGLFAVHARAYAAWLVDDAGISVAYAMNLARGFGLVAQPGAAPVEGYSDALWVFLLALFARAGALALPATLKALGLGFVAAAYAILLAIIRRVATRPLLVGAAALIFCSVNPAFVIWCMSGLENGLYTFTVVLLARLTLRALDEGDPISDGRGTMLSWASCGAAAVLVATTRPDGVLFALVPPALAAASGRRSRRTFVAYAIGFGAPMALFLFARLAVFDRLVPNTYDAKGGLRLGDALAFAALMPAAVHKLEGLLEDAFAGIVTNAVFLAAVVSARVVAKRRGFTIRRRADSTPTFSPSESIPLATLVAFTFVALADFMLLPPDRMGEHRFGTAFYPLYYASVFALLSEAIEVTAVRRKELALGAIAGSVLLASVPDFAGRAFLFARAPNIGLFYVRRAFAERIDRYAETLHLAAGASVLLPDVGAMLLWSHLRVIDGAGLCDRTIAQTLAREPVVTRAYIFGEVRPTFIHTHNVWAKALSLEEDPRFAADYAAIHVYSAAEDPESEGHAAGLFVRRDVLVEAGGEAALSPLRRESHFRLGFLPPPADTFVLRWLDRTPLVPVDYRERLSLILRDKTGMGDSNSRPSSPADR
jgi:hypothetical protein